MPLSFRRFFKKCCVIIDCTEIFVEHVIGLLKQKYTILQSVLPISLIANNDDNIDESAIDKIVRVCCAYIYLCPSVVPQE